jgi:hypothetical protein
MYEPYYQTSWALIVGINDYQYAQPLTYACNDADAVAKILVRNFRFSEDQIIVLKDKAATKQAILEEAYLGFIKKASDPNDRVLVFFAGHGTTRGGLRGSVGHLVPVDGDPDDPSTLIRWDDLTRNAELIPAKHILFIMDACYSGLALQRAVTPGTERFLSDMLQRPARQVITAGKADEVVADGGGPEGKNSIFTGFLIEGLEGAAADENGILTANGLMAYIYRKVGRDSHSYQTPHYGHLYGDGDFIFQGLGGESLFEEPLADALVQWVAGMPEISQAIVTPVIKPSFAERNGYTDPNDPSFGRNDWSSSLVEVRHGRNSPTELVKAFSWLSLIVEPVSNQPVVIDIAREAQQLRNYRALGDEPYERFVPPRESITTIDSVILYETLPRDSNQWKRYLRIDQDGNIEYAHGYNVFVEWDGVRFFRYVQVIGAIWQFVHFAKHLLSNAGYDMGVQLLVNLVGTRDTFLIDFAKGHGEDGKIWREPHDQTVWEPQLHLKCHDPHLQLRYSFALRTMDRTESEELILDVATKLGLAYNHQSAPRCFNYHTDVFPWSQYFAGQ